jgi:hypothetical protein
MPTIQLSAFCSLQGKPTCSINMSDEAIHNLSCLRCLHHLLPQALLQYTIASSETAKAASQPDGQQQQQQQDSAAALFQQLHTGEGFDAEQVGVSDMYTRWCTHGHYTL